MYQDYSYLYGDERFLELSEPEQMDLPFDPPVVAEDVVPETEEDDDDDDDEDEDDFDEDEETEEDVESVNILPVDDEPDEVKL